MYDSANSAPITKQSRPRRKGGRRKKSAPPPLKSYSNTRHYIKLSLRPTLTSQSTWPKQRPNDGSVLLLLLLLLLFRFFFFLRIAFVWIEPKDKHDPNTNRSFLKARGLLFYCVIMYVYSTRCCRRRLVFARHRRRRYYDNVIIHV